MQYDISHIETGVPKIYLEQRWNLDQRKIGEENVEERNRKKQRLTIYLYIYIYIRRKESRIEYALPMNKLIEFYRRWVRGFELVYQRRCPIRRYLVGPHYGR